MSTFARVTQRPEPLQSRGEYAALKQMPPTCFEKVVFGVSQTLVNFVGLHYLIAVKRGHMRQSLYRYHAMSM